MNSLEPSISDAELAEAAIVAVGSNLPGRFGTPEQMVRRALRELRSSGTRPALVSSLYLTLPWDCEPGTPKFVNAAAALWPRSDMAPESLLRELLEIEASFGRRATAGRNRPRTLDLDLICWGNRIVDSPRLRLPHPRFTEREFVLAPLAELAPRWIPPGQARSVVELLAALPGRDTVRMLPDRQTGN